MRVLTILAAAALAGCVSISVEDHSTGDAALAGIANARTRECPADRRQAGAHSSGPTETVGVASADLAISPLAHDATRIMRVRRLTLAPGAVIAWHEHTTTQGVVLVVSGEVTETRSDCLDPIVYRAGDVGREDIGMGHSWRNTGNGEAVVLVYHVLTR